MATGGKTAAIRAFPAAGENFTKEASPRLLPFQHSATTGWQFELYRKFKQPFFRREISRHTGEPSSVRELDDNCGLASDGSGDAAVGTT